MPLHLRTFLLVACFVLILMLGGCGAYSIDGRVVKGELPMVTFVAEDDPALSYSEPLGGAIVRLYRDPEHLSRREIASSRSRSDGWFTLSVRNFGTGWMDEEWDVQGRSAGRFVQDRVRLPSAKSRLIMLVILAPSGPDPQPGENLMEELERYR